MKPQEEQGLGVSGAYLWHQGSVREQAAAGASRAGDRDPQPTANVGHLVPT